jgi:hypothetical protein
VRAQQRGDLGGVDRAADQVVDADGGLPDQPGDHLVEGPVVGGDVEQLHDQRDEPVVQLTPPPVLGVHDRQHARVDGRVERAQLLRQRDQVRHRR